MKDDIDQDQDNGTQDSNANTFKFFFGSNDQHRTNTQEQSKTNSFKKPQINNLDKLFSKDIQKFKLSKDFSQSDLKAKYFFMSKQYHPDVRRNDITATKTFQEIMESYERLKIYYELREGIKDFSDYKEEDLKRKRQEEGFGEGDQDNLEIHKGNNWKPSFNAAKNRKEILEEIIIESQFTDMREPTYLVLYLKVYWLVIAGIVFYSEVW
eukprot:CAMPEP_0170518286 /NCGR_PEP_ID=MMETSP0209-20121228/4013_1 /TAXON_ID=665100 ORGANISM="Litonotus pictus, Strain P1" /NCGR_SAMPLE_ID=MMETSP0209 /ASSEMBLY_ACC=CAM_ASM_000301 /LENGTH=209 /DNA_ID=CAMNT_0010803789 /DNA_START=166 /DNA_END=792 /DNA_ORIENTATION=-